jgi:glycosyltransferase involved in cell wall biosynthesis
MIISILIRSLYNREAMLNSLLSNLYTQIVKGNYYFNVEVLVNRDNKEITSGAKANELLLAASGKYIVFIDDDDEVADNYIELMLNAMKTDADCIGTQGTYTINGGRPTRWYLSKDYQDMDDYQGGELVYLRRTNHISPVKRELALLAMFPNISNGEDKEYSRRLNPHLRTEEKITQPVYHYKYSTERKEYV